MLIQQRIIGARVMYKGHIGTVRYVGQFMDKEGTWVGIELDTPDGKNDGMVSGQRYFQCELNRGLFVPISKVTVMPASYLSTRGKVRTQGNNQTHNNNQIHSFISCVVV